jgi:hypothetical protein
LYIAYMKKLILSLLAILPLFAAAQSTTNPDTVCYQTPGSTYSVVNDPNNTYTWTVAAPGTITSGQGTNAIVVDWSSAAPGLITNAITVRAVNQFGCDTTVSINVFILNIVPTFTAQASCVDAGCIALVGTPAGGIFTGPGVTGQYEFCPSIAGVGSHTLTYTYSFAGCTWTTTGTGPFVVNPLPNISPISHN